MGGGAICVLWLGGAAGTRTICVLGLGGAAGTRTICVLGLGGAAGTRTNCVQKGAGGAKGLQKISGARGCSRHSNNLCSGARVWNRDMSITILC